MTPTNSFEVTNGTDTLRHGYVGEPQEGSGSGVASRVDRYPHLSTVGSTFGDCKVQSCALSESSPFRRTTLASCESGDHSGSQDSSLEPVGFSQTELSAYSSHLTVYAIEPEYQLDPAYRDIPWVALLISLRLYAFVGICIAAQYAWMHRRGIAKFVGMNLLVLGAFASAWLAVCLLALHFGGAL